MKRLIAILCLFPGLLLAEGGFTGQSSIEIKSGGNTLGVDTNGTVKTQQVNEYGNPVRINPETRVPVGITYEHHEIHRGSHYFIEQVADISINNVIDVQWTTPNSTKWDHFTFVLQCENETAWFIYEGAVVTNAGAALTAFNNDRNSTNTYGGTIAIITNTSVANANLDTGIDAATAIAAGIVGSGRDGGVDGRSKEIILKQNTTYCMRAIANAAGYSNFLMEWYTHTNKSD